MNGPQRHNFEQLREQINTELLNEQMPDRLYKSTNGIMRVIDAIVKTRGEGWAAQVLNDEGKPMLTKEEQTKFTEVFEPYIGSILEFFGKDDDIIGGAYEQNLSGSAYKPDISKMSGMSKDFLKTKAEQATFSYPPPPFDPTKMFGVDDIYSKIYHKVGNLNSTVNEYASKYGVLKMEKEHDLEEDVRVIPEPAAMAISSAVFGVLKIPPQITQQVLAKIKIPFRIIIFAIYLAVDIARLAIGITGPSIARKIMSILLAILELLRGDWKKALLTMMGYYGMMPMLIGELLKVFLTLFRMFAPQIQHSIIFGSLDATKSFIVGLLLAIFQVTAPEQVRLPLIGALEKIAQHKAQMDGTLEAVGLSARPPYLSPTWNDLNNIQAVMSDEAFICSCEFQQLVSAVDNSAIIRIVLQILRIPVNQDMIIYKCGQEPCKDFVTTVVSEAKEETDAQKAADAPFSMEDLKVPVDLNPLTSITAPVATNPPMPMPNAAAINAAKKAEEEKKKENENPEAPAAIEAAAPEQGAVPEEVKANEPKPPNNSVKGGRILHSRMRKMLIT